MTDRTSSDVALVDVLQENKRLRAALSAIAVGTPDLLPPYRIMGESQLRGMARKALDEVPDRSAGETTAEPINPANVAPAEHSSLARELRQFAADYEPACRTSHMVREAAYIIEQSAPQALPFAFVLVAQCASCEQKDTRGAVHTRECAAAPGRPVRP